MDDTVAGGGTQAERFSLDQASRFLFRRSKHGVHFSLSFSKGSIEHQLSEYWCSVLRVKERVRRALERRCCKVEGKTRAAAMHLLRLFKGLIKGGKSSMIMDSSMTERP